MVGDPEGCNGKEGGRGRPPLASQFRKGQSGNPAGRPRKSRDVKKLIDAELDQLVWLTENGKRIRLTKREIIVKKLVNGAVRGEDKPLMALLKLIGVAPEPEAVVTVDPAELARFALRYLPGSEQEDIQASQVGATEAVDGEANE